MVAWRTDDEIRKDGVEAARSEAVQRHFDLWRRTRPGRAWIPERLWSSAVKLAARYGVCRTVRTLRLDFNVLQQRVASAVLNNSPAGPMRLIRVSDRDLFAFQHLVCYHAGLKESPLSGSQIKPTARVVP